MHVTPLAIDRFLERIDGSLTRAEAEAKMLTASVAVERAAAFGCRVVKMGCGAKLILKGTTVVTVLERHRISADMLPGYPGARVAA